MAQKPGYELKVSGSYYAHEGTGKVMRRYENVKVVIPQQVHPKDHMWYLRNKLMPREIIKLNDAASSVREIFIRETRRVKSAETNSSSVKRNVPISEMNLDELDIFCMEHGLPIEPKSFSDIAKARLAVSDMYDDYRLAKKQKEAELTKAKQEEKEVAEMESLNQSGDETSNEAQAALAGGDDLFSDEENPLSGKPIYPNPGKASLDKINDVPGVQDEGYVD